MRITASFTLLLVVGNFKTSLEMAIIKGLGSLPETTEDYSSGETTRVSEAANVRSRDPETDSLNDVNLHRSIDVLETSTPMITTIIPKGKRCARRETIMTDDRVGATLSLTRRDVNLETAKQKCETCKKRFSCRFMKKCNRCKIHCDKVTTAEAATVTNNDDSLPQVTTDTNAIVEQINVDHETGTTEEVTVSDQNIVASRFGEQTSKYDSNPRYFSLGLIEPGPLMHLFVRTFNIQSEENFEKLIILGKLRGDEVRENLDNLLIIDLAHVFGNDNKFFATVHQPIKNIDPAKIVDLDKKLNEAIAKRKEVLNTNYLSNDQIHNVIDEVLEEVTQNDKPSSGIPKETAPVDQSVQLPETETKCSVDEAVEDLLDVIPVTVSERTKDQTKYQEEESKGYGHQEEQRITNPPVIQDGLGVVGKNFDDGWIDDNEEARPSLINDASKLKPAMQDDKRISTLKEDDHMNNVIGDSPNEILSVPGDVKSAPESDNQINEPVENVQQRVNLETTEQTEKVNDPAELKDNIVGESLESLPEDSLTKSIVKTVEDSLKLRPDISSNQRKTHENVIGESVSTTGSLQYIGEPLSTSRPLQDLEQNVIKVVDDSLKTGLSDVSNKGMSKENINDESVLDNKSAQDLAQNILNTVEDSLKVVTSDDDLMNENLKNAQQIQKVNQENKINEETTVSNNLPLVAQSKPVFLENNEETIPSQVEADNEEKVITFPETLSDHVNDLSEVEIKKDLLNDKFTEEPNTGDNDQINENVNPDEQQILNPQKNDKSSESEESEEIPLNETKIETNNYTVPPSTVRNPTVAETLPGVEIRGQFNEESGSQEKLSNFGSLIPRIGQSFENEDDQLKNLYFVGKNIKLPLRMYQDKNGVMQLRVDVEKLCHCKNKNCTRKHIDNDKVIKEAQRHNLKMDNEAVRNDMNTRSHNIYQRDEELMNSFMNNLDGHDENSEIFKRSPKISSKFDYNQQNSDENNKDETLKIDGIYKFQNVEEKQIEDELAKLNNNIKKYLETESPVVLNKGNVALFKDVEKTKDIGRMINLATDLLTWMKDLAPKNFSS